LKPWYRYTVRISLGIIIYLHHHLTTNNSLKSDTASIDELDTLLDTAILADDPFVQL